MCIQYRHVNTACFFFPQSMETALGAFEPIQLCGYGCVCTCVCVYMYICVYIHNFPYDNLIFNQKLLF